ncbi:hypothetical protein KCP75_22640 [Salmonella enterica subsp. enterica]|nr:hypothetical protein KCP75_22640 [Salmonella enterica subsp. enterica]
MTRVGALAASVGWQDAL